jgi:hypothetical protein
MSVLAPDVLTCYSAPPWEAWSPIASSLLTAVPSASLSGTKTSTQPVDEPGSAKVGYLAPQWGNLLFDQILAIPQEINFGYLLAERSDEAALWNTCRTSRTLDTVTGTGTSGIALTGADPETVVKPLQSIDYIITTSMSGPSIIDADYVFSFDVGSATIVLTGTRTLIFPHIPQSGQIETLEWLTDVLESYDGTEEREGARYAPRQEFDGLYWGETSHERMRMQAVLLGWHINTFSLPIWGESRQVGDVAADATVIMMDTANADYRDGGFMAILESYNKHEVLTITEVLADRVNLTYPVKQSYTTPVVAPARIARILGGTTSEDTPVQASRHRVRFEVIDTKVIASEASTVQYRGLDTLLAPYYISGEMQAREMTRPIEYIDYDTGLTAIDSGMDWSRIATKEIGVKVQSRADAWTFRKWLHRREGRFRPFWSPTFTRDVELAEPFGSADVDLYISKIEYATLLYNNPQFQNLAFFKTDGTVLLRQIVGYQMNDDDETITLDSALGFNGTMDSFDRISFLSLVRLSADRIEIAWQAAGRMSSNFGLMGLDDES